jgi:ferrous iron transport protein A
MPVPKASGSEEHPVGSTAPRPVGCTPPDGAINPGTPAAQTDLSRLACGRPAIVERVLGTDELGDRLLEMGLTPGAPVEVVRRAPFGDPLQIRVRGYLLAIRRAQAERVLVRV